MRAPATAVPAVILLIVLACGLAVAEETEATEETRVRAGGRLSWDLSDELDLLGDLWSELWFPVQGPHGILFGVDTRTEIEKATSDIAFLVSDLDYSIDLGYRDADGWFSGVPALLLAGQRGKQAVDREGSAWVRYVTLGFESPGYRRGDQPGRLDWRVEAGPVLEEQGVEADAIVRGRLRWNPITMGRFARAGFEVSLDSIFGDGSFQEDFAFGPTFVFPVPGGRRAVLFLQYQRSRNPLGLGHSGVLAGFEYSEGVAPVTDKPRSAGPEIDGALTAGHGEDSRNYGQLRLHLLSPRFLTRLQVAVDLDVNVLTATDRDDLYYLYDVGLEQARERFTVGGYFYHRSNHQIDSPNDRVTSINVLEAGIETPEWTLVGRRGVRHAWGRIDGRIRAGYLVDSSFGEENWWHLRGGLRWTPPGVAGRMYVLLEAETGDVQNYRVALGTSPFRNWDLQLEYRDDDQLFAAAQSLWLATLRYGF